MSYTKQTWHIGDTITANKLNTIEAGISDTDRAVTSLSNTVSTVNDTLSTLSSVAEVIDTSSGEIASFSNGSGLPMNSLLATVKPVQSLNGYDSPWPGGAGKNIFDYNTFQNKLITSDGVINDSTTRLLSDIFTVTANTTYLVTYPSSGFIFAGHIEYNDSDVYQSRILVDQTSGSTQITPSTNRIRLYFSKDPNSETISKNDLATVQVTEGTTAPDKFYPYANECPISGRTNLSGKVIGKNMLAFAPGTTTTSNGVTYTGNSDYTITVSGTATALSFGFESVHVMLKAGTYTLSASNATGIRTVAVVGSTTPFIDGNASIQFTLTEDTEVYAYCRVANGTTVDATPLIQIEVGSNATAYEAPQIVNIASGLNYIDKSFYNDNGESVASDNTKRLNKYLPVTPGESLSISLTTVRTNKIRVHEYDANKVWLRQIVNVDPPSATWTVSSDARYIRYSIPIDATNIQILGFGSTFRVNWAYDLGKNLYNPETVTTSAYINASGTITPITGSGDEIKCYSDLIPVTAGPITYSGTTDVTAPTWARRLHGYDASGNWVQQLGNTQPNGTSVVDFTINATVPSNVAYVRISGLTNDTNVQVELSSAKTTYEPYKGTVYGATIDVVSGEMIVGWKIVDLEALTWTATSWGGWRTSSISDLKIISVDSNANLVAEKYKSVSQKNVPSTENAIATGTFNTPQRFYVNCKDTPTGKLVYPLAEPIVYQLTPQQVNMLVGYNNVYTNSGPVSVNHAVNIQDALDQKVNKADGKGLSTNDYTTSEKNKLAGVQPQATKTIIDSTLSNEGQAADAKTTGDAIETVNNALSSLQSINEIIDTASGDIASFPDGAGTPMRSLLVQIEPKQDLHGYENPWPAGGGLNKLTKATLTDISLKGVTVTIADDGGITLNGTATANSTVTMPLDTPLAAGNYTWFTFNPSLGDGVSVSLRNSSKALVSGSYQLLTAENMTKQFSVAEDSYYWRFQINEDVTLNNFTFKPMLCVGTVESATYQPYANECPISGWSELSGKRCCVNLWDEDWEVGTINATTGADQSATTAIRSKNYIPIVSGATYYFRFGNGAEHTNIKSRWYDADKNYLGTGESWQCNSASTAPANAKYFRFSTQSDYGATYNNDISLNYPSTDTSYHAYTSLPITCNWVGVIGKNMLDMSSPYRPDSLVATDGTISANSNFDTWYFSQVGEFTTSMTVTEANNNGRIIIMNADGTKDTSVTLPSTIGRGSATFTLADGQIAYISIRKSATDCQIEAGSTATSYEPYKNIVYGANVDVVTGALTVTDAIYNPTGDEANYIQQTGRVVFAVPREYRGGDTIDRLCSDFSMAAGGTYCYVNTSMTVEELKTYFQSHTVQMVLPLTDTQTYQLTPQQIDTLFGNNTVFADCGPVSVTYQANLKDYIDKKLGV